MKGKINGLTFTFLAVGMLLLIIGISVWQAPEPAWTEVVAGTPTNKAPWLVIGGILFVILGVAASIRNRTAKTMR